MVVAKLNFVFIVESNVSIFYGVKLPLYTLPLKLNQRVVVVKFSQFIHVFVCSIVKCDHASMSLYGFC